MPLAQPVGPLLVPGRFFDSLNKTWRLEECLPRGFVRRCVSYTQGILEEPELFIPPANFRCHEKPIEVIYDEITKMWIKNAFQVEAGSERAERRGLKPTIVRKKRYRAGITFKTTDLPALRLHAGTDWGQGLIESFFAHIDSWSGFYEARTETFEFMECVGMEGGDEFIAGHRVYRKSWEKQGTVPDLSKYHDTSDPAAIKRLLDVIRDSVALIRLAADAKCGAVRETAAQLIRERAPQLSMPF